jgi:hypothetical protein
VRLALCVLALLLVLFTPSSRADDAARSAFLRLYFIPSYPVRLDWSAPNKVLASVIDATFHDHMEPIGHVVEEVSCGRGSHLFGAVGAGPGAIGNLLLTEQVGFSLLERGWPGAMETQDHILKLFKDKGHDPHNLAAVTFLINQTTCARLLDYERQYEAGTKPIYYGFGPRPRRMEGSGCSAFGESFVEVAGLMTDGLYEAWTTHRLVPLKIVAGHGVDRVPMNTILHGPDGVRWAKPGEPHMDLTFFDPDRMWEWVEHLANHPAELAALGGAKDDNLGYGIGTIPAIRLDRRDVPTPTEPIFTGQPSLRHVGTSSVERADLRVAPGQSFTIKP